MPRIHSSSKGPSSSSWESAEGEERLNVHGTSSNGMFIFSMITWNVDAHHDVKPCFLLPSLVVKDNLYHSLNSMISCIVARWVNRLKSGNRHLSSFMHALLLVFLGCQSSSVPCPPSFQKTKYGSSHVQCIGGWKMESPHTPSAIIAHV
ncbi:unnamed protein product [Linum trigynum]|uniref:Uncharacterized protein n=1 Tax=Linum trigynum TaxID=586398 RepID=A0AAV2G0N9_9ROSI